MWSNPILPKPYLTRTINPSSPARISAFQRLVRADKMPNFSRRYDGFVDFLLTSYFYPLSEPLVLSPSFGFALDNPRTRDEIEAVEDYLHRAYESGHDIRLPPHSSEQYLTIEQALFNIRDAVAEEDAYVREAFTEYEQEQLFTFIARNWIVARFENQGHGDDLRRQHREYRAKGIRTVTILEDDHPLVRQREALASYTYLLSLLLHDEVEDYNGRSLLVDPDPFEPSQPVTRVWWRLLQATIVATDYPRNRDQPTAWTFFPVIRESLPLVASRLERLLDGQRAETLLYIGGILRITGHETRDDRVRVLLLTSILELLLTHNPNFQRFNVEDSISKQFQLKIALILHHKDDSVNLEETKDKLKSIYALRSGIAHGDFEDVEHRLRRYPVVGEHPPGLGDVVTDLYWYVRLALERYLDDPAYVEFLKQG